MQKRSRSSFEDPLWPFTDATHDPTPTSPQRRSPSPTPLAQTSEHHTPELVPDPHPVTSEVKEEQEEFVYLGSLETEEVAIKKEWEEARAEMDQLAKKERGVTETVKQEKELLGLQAEQTLVLSGTRGRYKILQMKEKQELVRLAKEKGYQEVSKQFKVSINNLIRWQRHVERRKGAGRKVTDLAREKALVEWAQGYILEHREPPTRKGMQAMAKSLNPSDVSFKASKGWYQRFVCRHPDLDLKP